MSSGTLLSQFLGGFLNHEMRILTYFIYFFVTLLPYSQKRPGKVVSSALFLILA